MSSTVGMGFAAGRRGVRGSVDVVRVARRGAAAGRVSEGAVVRFVVFIALETSKRRAHQRRRGFWRGAPRIDRR